MELAPWSKNAGGDLLDPGPDDESLASNSVVRAVQRDGFYLARSELLRAARQSATSV
jgi:hypothetical protein